MNKPLTILITGLSASGKTTLGKRLKSDLEMEGINDVVLLDGEAVREQLNNYKYLNRNRNSIGIHKAHLAKDYNDDGKIAIVTGIYHQRDIREQIREIIDNYVEVYLKCDVNVCALRDYKGHYEKAFNGEYSNFIGVTDSYQESNNFLPELVLETSKYNIDESAKKLLSYILKMINAKS